MAVKSQLDRALLLDKGRWKWWYVIVFGFACVPFFLIFPSLVLHPNFMGLMAVVLPALLAWKLSVRDHGFVVKSWRRTILVSLLGFVLFTVAVYFFEKDSTAAAASKEVLESLEFGQSFKRDLFLIMQVCFLSPLVEEFLYRGLIFRSFWNSFCGIKSFGKYAKAFALVFATVVSAFLFMSAHGGGGQDAQMLMLFVLGVITAVSYAVTGSMYAPIMIHLMNNGFALFSGLREHEIALSEPGLVYAALVFPVLGLLITLALAKTMCRLEK